MATYKVLQDIEAEDKLIGPLSLRQFIYAGIAVLCGYLIFLLASKGAAFLSVIFLPPMIIAAVFAWPWSKDQPTEVWALAKIRFLVKPRKRIWDQSGVKELVTITAPKRLNISYTNGLTEGEVRSRLKALADTIDSRGWAIKNVNVNMYGQPALIMSEPNADRLISVANLPKAVPAIDIQPSEDMLDETNNPRAAQMDSKLEASTKARRQRVIEEMEHTSIGPPVPAAAAPAPANNYWFLNQPNQMATTVQSDAVTFNTQVITPGAPVTSLPVMPGNPTPDEETLLRQLEEQRKAQESVSTYSHLHTIQPLSAVQQAAKDAATAAQRQPRQTAISQQDDTQQPPVPEPAKPAILDLANNDDLNVATIAREASKRRELPEDEVVISLH